MHSPRSWATITCKAAASIAFSTGQGNCLPGFGYKPLPLFPEKRKPVDCSCTALPGLPRGTSSGVSYEPKPKDGEAAQQLDPIQLLELAATIRVESMLLLAVLFERGFGSVKPNALLSAQ